MARCKRCERALGFGITDCPHCATAAGPASARARESSPGRAETVNAQSHQTVAEANAVQVRAVFSLLVFCGLTWYLFFGGIEKQTTAKLEEIHTQVATDFATQYDIAKRNGSAMDACVAAGMVAAAVLQAKDEGGYQRWKATENADCARAGISK